MDKNFCLLHHTENLKTTVIKLYYAPSVNV